MPRQIAIDKAIKNQFLAQHFFASLISWNRLESRPRSQDFNRSLSAEVRDPLWMLCRQFQVGEFRGEDAGSAVVAKTQVIVSRVNRFAGQGPNPPAVSYDGRLPLETLVEHEAIPQNLLTRAQMGRHWLKLIAGIGDFKTMYVEKFPFNDELDGSEAQAQLHSDPDAWGMLQSLQRHLPDGGSLYYDITTPDAANPATDKHATWLGSMVSDPVKRQALKTAAKAFQDWFLRTYNQPGSKDPSTWEPGYLEYQFACSAPAGTNGESQTVLVADGYASGHLDWYSFDVDANSAGLFAGPGVNIPSSAPDVQPSLSFIPQPVTFSGMPAANFWKIDDKSRNYGGLNLNTTDMPAMLMVEFARLHDRDWSVVPYVLPVGSLSQVLGVIVKDVFGVKTLVRSAGQTQGDDLTRWGLFDLSLYHDYQVREQLFLPPVVAKLQESEPIEKVILVHHHMSNTVFGVEDRLPGLGDSSMNGLDAATALKNYLVSLHLSSAQPPNIVDTGAPVRYQLGQGLPENFIPLIPVLSQGSNRKIQLQRAAMPRLIPGMPETPVRPRGAFLRTGLDQGQPYFIHEEEVPKVGVILTRVFRRARGPNGEIVTWLGRLKQAGAHFSQILGLGWDKIV